MSRKSVINWGESDNQRIENEIKKFNSKIYQSRYRHPELKSILPDTIKKADKQKMVKELKLAPRSEFKKEVNTLERFNRKGAEKAITSKTGNTVTKWEKKEVGLKVAQINRGDKHWRKTSISNKSRTRDYLPVWVESTPNNRSKHFSWGN